jgi:hypothetical protein
VTEIKFQLAFLLKDIAIWLEDKHHRLLWSIDVREPIEAEMCAIKTRQSYMEGTREEKDKMLRDAGYARLEGIVDGRNVRAVVRARP